MKRNRIFKLSLLCLVLVVTTKTFAQQIESERDKIFEHVDLPQVPYGILEDYGLSSISLIPYTKRELDTTNYLNYATLQQIIGGLNSSMVLPHHPDSINLDRVNSLNEEYYGKGVVPITLLRYDLCRFSEEAVRRGDVYPLNDRIRVKGGISKSPYEELHLFAAAPFTSELSSRDVTFCIPQQLMLTNSQAIAQIEVQFEEGQPFRSIAIGEQISYRYATDGLKMVTLRIQQVGASRWYRSHFPIVISTQLVPKSKTETSGLVEVPIKSSWQLHSGGTLQYKLSPHNHTGKFRKPLFIVEGFDLYPIVISDTKKNSDLSDVFNNKTDLNRILDLGYDIAYLDYADGMGDIRRNAALFQEALRYINTHKEGDEKNVVVGLSMGGLVASYGLRKMELAGEDHETRKYISYDSPHMGANVPLGAFYMAYHWLNGDEFLKFRLATDCYLWIKGTPIRTTTLCGWLQKTGIRQLVPFDGSAYLSFLSNRCSLPLFSFTNPFDNIYNVPSEPNPEFASFHKEYKQMGLPRKTFNVAFSNGAIGASPIVPRGSHLAEANGYVYGLLGISPGVIASLFHNPGLHLNWAFLTSSTFTVEAYINAMPCQNPYYQDIALTKHYLFGLLPHTYHLSRMQVRVQNPNPLFNDIDAGGVYPISSQYTGNPLVEWTVNDSEESKFLSWFFSSKFRAKVNTSKFCFVPLNSSLGIPAGEKITSYEEAKRKSPFDFIYTVSGESSEQHISFWSHFNDFLLALKEDIPKDYRPQLDSTATICDCGTTLKVLNPLEGFTYEWHTSLMLDIPSSTQGNGIRATIYPSELAKEHSPFGKIGFVYVEAFFNGRKFASSDSCYVYIGKPTIERVEINQLEAENSYKGMHFPYPTVQISWPYWGNITEVEWENEKSTNNILNRNIIDYDFVKYPLDQMTYESITEHAMIRYDLQVRSHIMPSNDRRESSKDLLGPDGKPIEKYEFPDYIKEQSLIPKRTLQLYYEPSRTLFEKPGRYTLTYRLKNECGESEPGKFTYQCTKVLDGVIVTPSVVTTEDAMLQYDLTSHIWDRSKRRNLVDKNMKYMYEIWSTTGVLHRMGSVNFGEPLGVINLPYGQYLVKVWYYDAYKEFHIMRQ